MKIKTLLIALGTYSAFPAPLMRLLKRSGFRLLFAKDADTAISLCTIQTIDLILLDLFIPPYGAYAIVQALRNLDACVPLILIGPTDSVCETYRKEKENFAGCITLDDPEELVLRAIRSCLWKSSAYSMEEVTQLIEVAAQPMTLTDASGIVFYTNSEFQKLSGYYLDQLVGENPRLWRSGMQPTSFYESMWNTIQCGKSWTGHVINRRKVGSNYSAQMFIKPLQDLYQTSPRGFLAIHTPLD